MSNTKIVLLSRRSGATEWGVRNDRFAHAPEVADITSSEERRLEVQRKMAESQKRDWLNAEPTTEFKIVEVPYSAEPRHYL